MAGTRQHSENAKNWGICGSLNDGEVLYSSVSKANPSSASGLVAPMGPQALALMIEAEIIPRLMLAHRCEGQVPATALVAVRKPIFEDVAELARIVVEHDTVIACGYVDALRDQGVSLETIFLDLIAPAAQLLGKMWVADLTDFTEVTIGLSRLQQVLHHFGPAFENESGGTYVASRALLTTLPGDDHTFGINMVEEFFRRAGWDVRGGRFDSRQDLIEAVRAERFDLIGLSVGSDLLLPELSAVIVALRKASRNAKVRIVVGGRLFVEHPEFADLVGADGTAADARQAILQLSNPQSVRVGVTR